MLTAKEVKEARYQLGLNQGELASRLGVTLQSVSNWERGVRNISPDKAWLLQKLLAQSKAEGGISDNDLMVLVWERWDRIKGHAIMKRLIKEAGK